MNRIHTGLTVLALASALIALGCGTQSADSQPSSLLTYHGADLLEKYGELDKSGYEAMAAGDFDGAIALFGQQAALIPTGRQGAYNLACAYSRSGQVDEAMNTLRRAVEEGYCDAQKIAGDSDLDAIRDHEGYEALLAAAEQALARKAHLIIAGVPRFDTPPVTFASEEELEVWYAERKESIDSHAAGVWQKWEAIVARSDLAGRMLAARRDLAGDGYEYDLGRVRETYALRPNERSGWGPIAIAIMNEVDVFLAGDRPAESVDRAAFYGALAAVSENSLENPNTQPFRAAANNADGYAARISADSRYYGGAKAILLAVAVAETENDDTEAVTLAKAFMEEFGDEDLAMGVAATLCSAAIIKAAWPVSFTAVDLNGTPVHLDDYRGKVVLIDFWATWCPPCIAELPALKAAYTKYHDQGFEILSVSLDYAGAMSDEEFGNWTAENGMNWRHVYDGKGWDSQLVVDFHVTSVPTPYLIGRDGSLVALKSECRGEALAESIAGAL